MLRRPGVYVVELIGNGLSSRAVIHKGRLRHTERLGAAAARRQQRGEVVVRDGVARVRGDRALVRGGGGRAVAGRLLADAEVAELVGGGHLGLPSCPAERSSSSPISPHFARSLCVHDHHVILLVIHLSTHTDTHGLARERGAL